MSDSRCGDVVYGKGPTGALLDSGRLVVWTLDSYCDWNGIVQTVGSWGIGWEYKVAYSEDPTSVPPGSGRLVVQTLDSCSWNRVIQTIGSCNTL